MARITISVGVKNLHGHFIAIGFAPLDVNKTAKVAAREYLQTSPVIEAVANC